MKRILLFITVFLSVLSCKDDHHESSSEDYDLIAAFDKVKQSSVKRDISYMPKWQERIEFEGSSYIPLKTDKRIYSYTQDSVKYSLEGKIWLKANKEGANWKFTILNILPNDPEYNKKSGIFLYEDWKTGQFSYLGYVEDRLYSPSAYNNTLKLKGYVKKGHIPPPCNFIYSTVCAGEGEDQVCTTRSTMVCSDATGGGGSGTGGGSGDGSGGGNHGGGGGSTPPIIPPNTPSKEDKEIIDSLQGYPCAQAVLAKIPNLQNKISEWLKKEFSKTPSPDERIYIIKFNASLQLGNNVDGQHIGYETSAKEVHLVTLNGNMLKTASQEYIAATIFHESLHAFLLSERLRLKALNQESQFAILYPGWTPYTIGGQVKYANDQNNFGTLLEDLKKALKTFNPSLTESEASALTKGGVITSMTQAEIDINKNHKDGKTGTKCTP